MLNWFQHLKKPKPEIPNQVRDDRMTRTQPGYETKQVSASDFKRNGFTLIEVVVALAILGIALTVIIELFAGGLRLARASKEYTKAVNYVNTKMEEMDSQRTLEEGITEGEFDETFHWRMTTNKINILGVERPWEVKVPIQLFKIRVDVLWKSGPKERSTSTETYRTMKVQDDEKKS
jgi:general secretion pathway protein I